MRIFIGLKEAFNEIQRDLHEMGVLVYPESMQDRKASEVGVIETKEIQGYCYKITNREDLIKDFEKLGGNLDYINQEVMDRVSKSCLNPGYAYKHREDVWNRFLHDGKFSYTYNERIRSQLPSILDQLRENPNTRQAIITIFDQHQDLENMGGSARIPCSMYYQFLIRERGGKKFLDIIYTMRSCDIYTHLIYDIVLTMKMQEFVSKLLKIEPGYFTHFIGSMHMYREDYSKKEVF